MARILGILILLGGLFLAVYLVGQKTGLLGKAAYYGSSLTRTNQQIGSVVVLPSGITLEETWMGNLGYFRITENGQTSGWSKPVDVRNYPGSGDVQAVTATVSSNFLVQTVTRGGITYTRTVPLDSFGNPVWAEAKPWKN
jgi:hypothetical protein